MHNVKVKTIKIVIVLLCCFWWINTYAVAHAAILEGSSYELSGDNKFVAHKYNTSERFCYGENSLGKDCLDTQVP